MKRLSSNVLVFLAMCSVNGVSGQATNRGEPPAASISYSTLDEAMEALRTKPGVKFREEGGWTVAEDENGLVLWLLTPRGHPAYPSIVRRTIVNRADGAHFETAVRCFASKDVCDQFFGAN